VLQGQSPGEIANITYGAIKKLRGEVAKAEFQLMMGTGATESHFYNRIQIGGGPARGVFGVEVGTAKDIYINYLRYRPRLYGKLMHIVFHLGSAPFFVPEDEDITALLMLYDDYSALMARFVYLRRPPPIPTWLGDQAAYYKTWYNTEAGKGSPEKYIRDWKECNCPALVRAFFP